MLHPILEKNATIGPKICGGVITNHAFEYLKLPEDIQVNKFREISVYNNSKSATMKKKDSFIYTVDRGILGQWQLKKLNRESIEIRTGARVSKITKDYLIVDNREKFTFKYLVGADGVASIVRKYLKLKTDFVTNSSSTAYIVFIPEHYNPKAERITLLSEYIDYLEDEKPTKIEMLDMINEIIRDIDFLKNGKSIEIGSYAKETLILFELLDKEDLILKKVDVDGEGGTTITPITLDELKSFISKVESK